MTYRCFQIYTGGFMAGILGGVAVGCSPQNNPPTALVPSTVPTSPPALATQSIALPSPAVSPAPVATTDPTAATASPTVAASPTPQSPDPTLLHKIKHDLSTKVVIAKQDTGKTYLSNLLLSQQAAKLVRGEFSGDLKRLSPDFPTETDEYRIEIRQANASQAVMVAVAKQSGYPSYTGAVYALEGKIPITGICKTNVPSLTPPQAPKLIQSVLMCPSGSSTVN